MKILNLRKKFFIGLFCTAILPSFAQIGGIKDEKKAKKWIEDNEAKAFSKGNATIEIIAPKYRLTGWRNTAQEFYQMRLEQEDSIETVFKNKKLFYHYVHQDYWLPIYLTEGQEVQDIIMSNILSIKSVKNFKFESEKEYKNQKYDVFEGELDPKTFFVNYYDIIQSSLKKVKVHYWLTENNDIKRLEYFMTLSGKNTAYANIELLVDSVKDMPDAIVENKKLDKKYADLPALNADSLIVIAADSSIVKPTFPNGTDALYKFIGMQIRYPKSARELDIMGTVYIDFVVETDGSITNIRPRKALGGGLTEEAMRVVSLMPRWIPGTQNGIPIRMKYTLPIKFVNEGINFQTIYGKN